MLQHLSYEEITNFIKHLGKFKHCLITNDVDPASLTCTNFDIKTGEYRLLDLTQSPFNLKGDKILNFFVADGSWVKQVLWIH